MSSDFDWNTPDKIPKFYVPILLYEPEIYKHYGLHPFRNTFMGYCVKNYYGGGVTFYCYELKYDHKDSALYPKYWKYVELPKGEPK